MRTFFFSETRAPGIFGAPDSHPSTLIDLQNNALASSESVEPKCMISEGYRTHRGVTGPMNFKKRRFFSENRVPGNFGAPGCHPNTLIELANTAMASRGSVATICMICEGCRTHRGATGPMNFKKRRFFLRKIVFPGFLGPPAAIQTP